MRRIDAIRIAFRDRLLKLYTHDYIRLMRRRNANRELRAFRKRSTPLTAEQKRDILSFWDQYRNVRKEMDWFAFYNTVCENKELLKYYIPDTIYYAEIDTFFTDVRRSECLDDKNLYDIYFPDIKRPLTIFRKMNGEYFDENYHVISLDQALERCQQAGKVIAKEALMSGGGFGVKFFDFSTTPADKFTEWLGKNDNVIIQEVVKQHETLSNIHPSSVNTLRMMSLFLDGETIILSSLLRMGASGSHVDNGSSGGVFCGINKDGTLKEHGHYTDGRICTQHPQGTVFKGFKVVGYERCCEIIKETASRMATATRLISWDFAIGQDGEPILIELNLTYGGLSTHLLSNGPLFGDRTPEILARVYNKHTN
jgi:hypothetical protein